MLLATLLLPVHLSAVAQVDVSQDAVSDVTDTRNVAARGVSMDWSSLVSNRAQVPSVENRIFGYPTDTPHFWTKEAHSFSGR